MDEKREEARRAAAEARARGAAEKRQAAAKAQTKDVMAGLRELGFRAEEARRAAEYSESHKDATLEERMRLALVFLCPKPRLEGRVEASVGAMT